MNNKPSPQFHTAALSDTLNSPPYITLSLNIPHTHPTAHCPHRNLKRKQLMGYLLSSRHTTLIMFSMISMFRNVRLLPEIYNLLFLFYYYSLAYYKRDLFLQKS